MEISGRSGQGEIIELESCRMLSLKMEGHSHKTQVESCYVCGNKGYSELLVCCSDCSELAVHRYCLGIVPGGIEDKEDFYWVCYYCCQSLNTAACDQTSDSVLTENPDRESESDKTERKVIEEQPKPLCIIYPEGYSNISEGPETKEDYQQYVSYVMEHPTEISRGVVLIVSPSGEVIIQDETSLFDDSSDLCYILSVTSDQHGYQ